MLQMNERSYKPTYGMASIIFFAQLYFYLAIGLIPVGICLSLKRNEDIKLILLDCILLPLIMFVLFSIIPLIINVVSKYFTKKKVILTDESIEYNGKSMSFTKISKISFSLGQISRYSSGNPCYLYIIAKNNDYLSIERPSFLMLLRLRKLLKDARFEIEDLKKKIFIYPLITLIASIIFSIFLYYFA